MGTDKHLQLRASPRSALGKAISYIQDDPTDNQDLAGETLIGRFLPFTVDPNDKRFQMIAIRCAVECEAWGRAIREYAGLPIPSTYERTTVQFPVPDRLGHPTEVDGDMDSCSSTKPSESSILKQKRRDSMRSMGLDV